MSLIRRPVSYVGAMSAQEWRLLCPESLRTSYTISEEQQNEWFDGISARLHHERWWEFVTENKLIVAMGGLTGIQWENGLAEISLIVDPEQARKGIGSEAALSILDAAFRELRLETVVGECYECSPAMQFWQAVIDAWPGRIEVCRIPHRKFWQGIHYGSLYFTIFKEGK